MAIAAIAASLLLTRSRETESTGLYPAGENAPARLKLDALREAGL